MAVRPAAVILASTVGVVVLASPADVRACTCIKTDAETAFGAATAVFEGRWTSGDSDRATFRVLRIWKGLEDDPNDVDVELGEHFALCGGFPESSLVAEAGAAHVVYAAEEDHALMLAACGRYFPSERAAAEFAFLDSVAAARTPVLEPDPPGNAAGDPATEPPQIVPPPTPPPHAAHGCRVGETPGRSSLAILFGILLLAPRRRARGCPGGAVASTRAVSV
jgi:hypothetical protein